VKAELARLLLYRGRASDARALVRDVADVSVRLEVALGAGDIEAARKIAAEPRTDFDESFYPGVTAKLLSDPGRMLEPVERRFATSGSQEGLYLALLYKLVSNSQDAATALDQVWARIDRATWEPRMRAGDRTVWPEMLAGYVHGNVARAEIFSPLADDAAFAASSFRFLPMSRRGIRCEADFYDGLHRHAREGLESSASARSYFLERSMAKFVLEHEAKAW
jgi:hypothetical protein